MSVDAALSSGTEAGTEAGAGSVSRSVTGSVTGSVTTDVGARSGTDRIDPRAVGPFRLPSAERASLMGIAKKAAACLDQEGIASDVVEGPSGRPRLEVVGNDPARVQGTLCPTDALGTPTPTEEKALAALNELVDACLDRQERESVRLDLDLSWGPGTGREPEVAPGATAEPAAVPREVARPTPSPSFTVDALTSENDRAIASCVGIARQEQLSSYVASPALLFISDPSGGAVPGFELSPANTARITGVAALVLALTVGASVLAGARLVRPLHALTGAAQRMRDGEDSAPVVVTTDNEIGRLAVAFNDMSAHRARLEEQRKVMVSDVAHELRTPLSNIRGWLEGPRTGSLIPTPCSSPRSWRRRCSCSTSSTTSRTCRRRTRARCVCTPSRYGSGICSPTSRRPTRHRPTWRRLL